MDSSTVYIHGLLMHLNLNILKLYFCTALTVILNVQAHQNLPFEVTLILYECSLGEQKRLSNTLNNLTDPKRLNVGYILSKCQLMLSLK